MAKRPRPYATRHGSISGRFGISAAIWTSPSVHCGRCRTRSSPRINAERYMLLAEIMMRQGRYDDAIAALQRLAWAPRLDRVCASSISAWRWCASGRLAEAMPHLDAVGPDRDLERGIPALRDKANLALGFALLQAKRAGRCAADPGAGAAGGPLLEQGAARRRLGGSAHGREFKRALVPWLALHNRNLLDSAVQESYLAVPYAFGQLGAERPGRRVLQFGDRVVRRRDPLIDDSIGKIRDGNLLDRLLVNDDKKIRHLVLAAQNLPRRRSRATCTSCSPATNSRKD